MEIKQNEVYTVEEAQNLLKISRSTMMRLIKKGAIRAAKVGKQYRILGRELLHMLSPALEDKARDAYQKSRQCQKTYREIQSRQRREIQIDLDRI